MTIPGAREPSGMVGQWSGRRTSSFGPKIWALMFEMKVVRSVIVRKSRGGVSEVAEENGRGVGRAASLGPTVVWELRSQLDVSKGRMR